MFHIHDCKCQFTIISIDQGQTRQKRTTNMHLHISCFLQFMQIGLANQYCKMLFNLLSIVFICPCMLHWVRHWKIRYSKKYIFYFNIIICYELYGCWQFEAKLGKTLVYFRLIGLGRWEGPRGCSQLCTNVHLSPFYLCSVQVLGDALYAHPVHIYVWLEP